MIECNYSDDILDENIRRGNTPVLICKWVLNFYMELGVLLGILNVNDLMVVNKIVLIHLSDGNSDADLFQKIVEEATGKNVFIAAPGMNILFNKTPF